MIKDLVIFRKQNKLNYKKKFFQLYELDCYIFHN